MRKQPQFSICLIAKNEEKTIPRLMESLKEFRTSGGEIVLVDTGSTDATMDVARSYGCKTHAAGSRFIREIDYELAKNINQNLITGGEEPVVSAGDKVFDFSSARNFAHDLASNDMIFTPDCDEYLESMDLDWIDEKLTSGIRHIDYPYVFAFDKFGNEIIKFKQGKFYDRTLVQWKGIVHEVVSHMGRQATAGPDQLKLCHAQNHATNRSGYLKGLALDFYLNQSNDRNAHYLARELYWTGRYKSAIALFERHIAMNGWDLERARSMVLMGDCKYRMGMEDKAKMDMHKAFEFAPSRREPLIFLAQYAAKKGDYRKVVAYCEAALTIPYSEFYANISGHYTNEPHEMLYLAYWWLGDRKKSKEHYDKCVEMMPFHVKYVKDSVFYGEYSPPSIEGWMSANECKFLHDMARRVSSVCEIGSWKGRSTRCLLDGCKDVTAVDHWNGSAQEGDGTHGKDVYDEFIWNVGSAEGLSVVRMPSAEAASAIDKKFDMIFIDAGHTYEEVKRDIEVWRGKAKVILCGHDYCDAWPGVKKAVDESIGKPDGVIESIWFKIIS